MKRLLFTFKVAVKLGVFLFLLVFVLFFIQSPKEQANPFDLSQWVLGLFTRPTKVKRFNLSKWFEFNMPWDDTSNTFINLNSEGAAGAEGFVRIGEDGHFYLQNGERIRFWGTVLGYQSLYPSKKQAEKIAARLAKFGFNLVRIGSLDAGIFDSDYQDTRHFDQEKLDRFDYLVSQLKKNGIYIDLVITGYRKFKTGDQVKDWNSSKFSQGYRGERLLRAMTFFDSHLQELQKEYAGKLLSHRNPYTGNKYKDEPAIAMVEVINETTLDLAWLSDMLNFRSSKSIKVTKYYSTQLDKLWNQWLAKKYNSTQNLQAAWESNLANQKGLLKGEKLELGNVRRILYSEAERYSKKRVHDLQLFYHQLQKEYFTGFIDYLKNEVGAKVPISASHTFHGMPHLITQSYTDYTGMHIPWEHPLTGQGWRTARFLNDPMVKAETTSKPHTGDWIESKNTLYRMAFGGAVKNKPMVISETNTPFPNEYQAEYPLLLSAYASLQDWDGVIIHQYIYKLSRLKLEKIDTYFSIANNLILMAQMPVASLAFRKGYIKPAKKLVNIPYTQIQAFDAFLKCGIDIHCVNKFRGVDPHWLFVHKVRNVFESSPQSLPNLKIENPFYSDTGELEWNIKKGLVKVNSPKVKAIIGFLGEDPIRLGDLTIQSKTDFAAISLIPLDGEPIFNSGKLLLTTASRVRNKGMKIEKDLAGFYHLKDWGEGPAVVQPVKAGIKLTYKDEDTVKVFPLDERGKVMGESVANRAGDEIYFTTGEDDTLWYGIKVNKRESKQSEK